MPFPIMFPPQNDGCLEYLCTNTTENVSNVLCACQDIPKETDFIGVSIFIITFAMCIVLHWYVAFRTHRLPKDKTE